VYTHTACSRTIFWQVCRSCRRRRRACRPGRRPCGRRGWPCGTSTRSPSRTSCPRRRRPRGRRPRRRPRGRPRPTCSPAHGGPRRSRTSPRRWARCPGPPPPAGPDAGATAGAPLLPSASASPPGSTTTSWCASPSRCSPSGPIGSPVAGKQHNPVKGSNNTVQSLLILRMFPHNGLKLDKNLIFSGYVQNV